MCVLLVIPVIINIRIIYNINKLTRNNFTATVIPGILACSHNNRFVVITNKHSNPVMPGVYVVLLKISGLINLKLLISLMKSKYWNY